ncbi:MAG: multidrug transporter AcrB [Armatimonadetes bacterium CG_4_10_14_3_um_filter_66_18]|nr:efflux RND transporter permease subunit [Armatimonadota bacterium]PIX46502.1 MAG: multidrug transporter AcrB [Armatimonadetes bacterium CG_4_8_14_3_um_filter_66_20]PIY37772.1 MAG: multidrug transporter AcrB [Armatimonadetes bacterium CG_4_10_14_3_um_filter_66_18]NCO93660.1 efflux RND transporter permease subunit [Armatimonadota bacterium]NCQ26851.1 efflux RND transporter permease subunit [Armatimonadota bacterium]
MSPQLGPAGRIARFFIDSKLTPLIIVASLLLGVFSVIRLPREEEPQIIVPMIDVLVQAPGMGSKEVESRVTSPMEKLLWEIPGVEYVYSTSSAGMSMAIARFYVGTDEEKAIVRTYNKMFANFDRIPQGVSQPLIKPRSIDDVPILGLTFHGKGYDHYQLRRIAAEVERQVKEIPDVSETTLIGGQRRQLKSTLDATRLSGFNLSPLVVAQRLQQANQQLPAGSFSRGNKELLVETGKFLQSAAEVGQVVVGVSGGRPVFVRDVATVEEGPEEPANYAFFVGGAAAGHEGPAKAPHGAGESDRSDKAVAASPQPAVTLAVAKRKGTNAIVLADKVLEKVEGLKGTYIPKDVLVTTTRNYGETAAEKSNELLFHMGIAILSVTLLVALTLGFRESAVVLFAIPVTLALTLLVFFLYGYTLNRITLFALIFSIGILVDDAIVVVENVVRHFRLPENRGRSLTEVAVEAVDEVGNPTILATFAVIAAVLPMAFVGGMMGPYMRPIPIGSSAAMVFSLFIAFVISPWAALRILKGHAGKTGGHGDHDSAPEGPSTRLYRVVMGALLHNRLVRLSFLVGVIVLLLGALAFVPLKWVTVKMLPFDNKNEFQVIVDMDEGTTLETTSRVTEDIADYLKDEPEVTDVQRYVGTAGPYNFNGLVRHYYLRRGANVADLQVNLLPKHDRKAQSHDLAKRVRPKLDEIAARYGATVTIAEVPPGPPVLQTLVAEIYGPDYEKQRELGRKIRDLFRRTEGIVDVDWYTEADQSKFQFVVDKEKAALNGISTEQVTHTLGLALNGMSIGLAHQPLEQEDVPLVVRLPRAERSSLEDLKEIKVMSPTGVLVPLGELVTVKEVTADKSIYHKNLMPVVYVVADVGGRQESPVYAILKLNKKLHQMRCEGQKIKLYNSTLPASSDHWAMKWDGEWHVTIEVFRDLGIAFGAVMILIYVLVVGWFQHFKTPLVIMAAIPFSLVGILPAHAALGAFFTATSMIGFIAGAGIVVRNSIILVDFIELRLQQGMPLDQAVIDAGAVRFRPMLLTAAAVIVGASVILFDPIFQGLAISLMAGEVASLLLSRMTVPVLYFVRKRRELAVRGDRQDVPTQS